MTFCQLCCSQLIVSLYHDSPLHHKILDRNIFVLDENFGTLRLTFQRRVLLRHDAFHVNPRFVLVTSSEIVYCIEVDVRREIYHFRLKE